MDLRTSLLVLLGCFVLVASEDEICPYRSTVNLTNQQSFHNGSYVYQDILIPPDKQSFYNYHLLFREEEVAVPRHLRGCVCDYTKSCLKLCCARDQFFNTSSYKCEKLSGEVVWNLEIKLNNGTFKNVNIFQQFIYQLGVPCRKPEAFMEEFDNWNLLENGFLHVEFDDALLNTLNYCYTPIRSTESEEYLLVPMSCPVKNTLSWSMLLNTYAMAISVLFLIPTIVVYLIFKELRGNLRGKLLICYLISLTIGYAIISFINISNMLFGYITCCLLGYTCYFFFMSAFLWLSVLCCDIWMNFRDTFMDQNCRKNQIRFIYYSIYAWGLSSVCTCLVIGVDLAPHIPKFYKPGIGTEVCWLDTQKWSASLYFYGPNLIILIFNFVTFAHLTLRIYKVRSDLAKMTQKEKFFQENAVVILRLFLIMGISWLFDIISYGFQTYKYSNILFALSDFANAIQGILIFSLFVMKRNVLNLWKKRYNYNATEKPTRSAASSTTNFSKLQTSNSIEASQTCASQLTP